MWTFVVDPFGTDDRFHGKFETKKRHMRLQNNMNSRIKIFF